jgi:hypothetical protein
MITKLRIENIISKNFLYFVQLPYLINAFMQIGNRAMMKTRYMRKY